MPTTNPPVFQGVDRVVVNGRNHSKLDSSTGLLIRQRQVRIILWCRLQKVFVSPVGPYV